MKRRVHDLGGTRGRGRIVVERDEPVYHAPWEGRVHAMVRRLLGRGVFNLDEVRESAERAPRYLSSSC